MANKRLICEQQHRLALEQSQLVGYWAKTKGITQRDFVNHPYIDDVILLIAFRDEFWNDMTQGQKQSWNCYWDWCYTQKKKIRNSHLKKLIEINIRIQNNRHWKKLRRQQQRQRIQAMRSNNTVATQTKKISALYMTAKNAGSPQSVPWD